MIANIFTFVFVFLGGMFFLAGTIGLIRFPDVYSRLHALTKTDNLGLGLIVIGLIPQCSNLFDAAKLLLIWSLVLFTSATSCHLVARYEYRKRPAKAFMEFKSGD